MKLRLQNVCVAALVGCVFSIPGYAYNSFDISNSEPCPGDSVVVIATWCPWNVRSMPPEPTICVLSGNPAPFLVLVDSGTTIDGGWWHYRAGPNPGQLHITADPETGNPLHSIYSAAIRIRGEADGGGGCATCGGGGGDSLGSERVSIGDGPLVEFAVGSIKADPQSPVHDVRLVLAAQTPGAALADPNSLQISGIPQQLLGVPELRICDYRNDPNPCFPYDRCGVLSLWANGSSAVVRPISSTEFEIRLYPSSAYGFHGGNCPSGSCCATSTNPPLVKWQVSSPSNNELVVTRRSPDDVIEVQYEFLCTDGDRSWQVTTGDGMDDYRREALIWVFDQQLGQWRRDHTIELRSSSGAWYTQSKRSTWHASVDDPWTIEAVDPDGPNPQETTREFHDETAGEFDGAVKWQVNADGSWEWYEYPTDFPATNGTVRVYRGWKDDAYPNSIIGWGTYTSTTYEPKWEQSKSGILEVAGLTVGVEESYVQGSLVRKFRSSRDPNTIPARSEERYWTPSLALATHVEFEPYLRYGSTPTATSAPFAPFPADRWLWNKMNQPDGTEQVRTFDAAIGASLDQSSWMVTIVDGGLGYGIETTQTAPGSTSIEIYDPKGRQIFTGFKWDSDSAPSDDNPYPEWTFHEYDARGRLAGEYHANGTKRTIVWTDCCRSRIETSVDGVQTKYESDPAGRPILEVREIGAQKREIKQYVYSAETHEARTLPAVTVLHGFDELPFGTPVGAFTVLRSTRTISDLAGRVVAEIILDASGAELLKTTHAYGSTPEGGRQVTTTRPDGQTEIRAYYRDGQLKSVTGTGVVPTHYVYSAAEGSLTTTVYTGSNPSERYVTTTRDMLGRVMTEQRPGWSSAGSETLTTTYFYDSQGDLTKTETRNSGGALVAAPQLYEHDRSPYSIVQRSGIEPTEPGNGLLEPGGDDRYTEVIASSETVGNQTYRVRTTKTFEAGGSERILAIEKDLVGGFGTVNNPDVGDWKVVGYQKSQDERGDEIVQTTTLNSATRNRKVHSKHSDWANIGVDAWEYGRRTSALSRTGVLTNYEYDGIGRETSASDGRTATKTDYDAVGHVWKSKDFANRTTEYLYYGQGEAGAGPMVSGTRSVGADGCVDCG